MKLIQLSLVILIVTIVTTSIFAQPKGSPYKMHAVLDFPIVAVSGLGSAGARFLQRQVEPLSGVEISNLSTANIPQFDLSAHSLWSPTADKVSKFGTYAAMLTPGLLLFSPDIDRRDLGTIILLSAETFAMTDFVIQMTKVQALRPRPYLYNPDITVPNNLLIDRDHRFSMLSGSTAYSAAMTFAGASMFADFHPKSKYKPFVWIAAAVIPATIGYLRYRSGMHYPSDIIIGYAVGASVGMAVPYIHRKAKVWFR
ncbi:MAG: membrane-associated phospholipid phosphatase [Saprospiraceae bacterium]|jgi:membrane-associated phospholipid phosphatase